MTLRQFTFLAYMSLLVTACNSNTEVVRRSNNDSVSRISLREENFISDAIENNHEAMTFLRDGVNKSDDAELKSSAGKMLVDHEKLDKTLRDYAAKKNYTPDIDTAVSININKPAGSVWDEEWADEVGDKTQDLARRFSRAEHWAATPELKDIVSRSLPVLRANQDIAEKLENKFEKEKSSTNLIEK
jgi:predicted outer membrane protein